MEEAAVNRDEVNIMKNIKRKQEEELREKELKKSRRWDVTEETHKNTSSSASIEATPMRGSGIFILSIFIIIIFRYG